MNVFNIRRDATTSTVAYHATVKPPAQQSALQRRPGSTTVISTVSRIIPMTLLAMSGAVSATYAQAEVAQGQFELSPFVGYHVFESDQNLEDSATYGIRFGYSFTPNWAVEAALAKTGTSVDDASLVGAREGQFRSPADNVDLLLYHIDALYHFRPENRFSPYVVGGIGAIDYSPDISDKQMAAFNLGAGAKYWVTENLALRFDLRNHLVGEVFDHSYNNIVATVGLSMAFGGKGPTKPLAAVTPSPVEKKVVADVIVLEFEDIHFDFDQSRLTNDARSILQRSIDTLKNNPESRVRIAGYTSAAGDSRHNQTLSEQRAKTIKNYLIEEGGISSDRLSVIGYGDTRPGSHEASPEKLNSAAAKANMRALFEIVVE